MISVDFHTHTSVSRDSWLPPDRLVRAALDSGLEAVAVCDHGTVRGAIEAAAIAPPSLQVIVGIEVKTRQGEIIGLFVREDVPGDLSPEETIELIRGQGGVVVVPHPFDRWRRSALERDALDRVAHLIDAVEGFNARSLHREDDRKAVVWAAERGLPVLAGSDAHTYGEVGRARTRMPRFGDGESCREALASSAMEGKRSPVTVHLATKAAKLLRGV